MIFEDALSSTSREVVLVGIWNRRLIYLAVALSVMVLGLSLRRLEQSLPDFFGLYVGDVLWALMAFLGISVFIPNRSTIQRGLIAIAFADAIELSQFYHAPWVDALRRTTVGGLVLGFGVLWTDFVCYAVGVAIGMLIDRWLVSPEFKP